MVEVFKNKMNKLSNICHKITLIADLLIARIINIFSIFLKKNTSSYILIYAPFKGEPWILNKIINDIKANSKNPNNYKIYNSLIKLSFFRFLNGGNIFSMHQSNIRYLEMAGFDLNNITSYYTHTRLNQKGIKNISKLKKIFCQNNYEKSLLQSLGIQSNKIINFPVGLHIADKYAKVPDYISKGIASQYKFMALKKAYLSGNKKTMDATKKLFMVDPRSFFNRPK